MTQPSPRRRSRELGITIGHHSPGRWNAITDVAGVKVGHVTLISGDGASDTGRGPVRTGVTIVVPRDDIEREPVFAGYHVLNGNGEMTGTAWISESGLLTTPIGLTNTHSVGVVRDAMITYRVEHKGNTPAWSLPVVAETYDGFLSDINGMHVRPEHVFAAFDEVASGPVAEGNVGSGTGMLCHGFKGGMGTSSRVLAAEDGGWATGVLVQANYGQRHRLQVDGVPVGEAIPVSEIPAPGSPPDGTGSIIVIVATDAPLIAAQCRRLAQRASLGIGRVGGLGENGSGDLLLAFSTGNHGLQPVDQTSPISLSMLPHVALNPFFEAVVEATEEAIVNALCAATTMSGNEHRTAHALPLDRLQAVMRTYGRLS